MTDAKLNTQALSLQTEALRILRKREFLTIIKIIAELELVEVRNHD